MKQFQSFFFFFFWSNAQFCSVDSTSNWKTVLGWKHWSYRLCSSPPLSLSSLLVSHWILRIQTHIKSCTQIDDSDYFTAWWATCRNSLRERSPDSWPRGDTEQGAEAVDGGNARLHHLAERWPLLWLSHTEKDADPLLCQSLTPTGNTHHKNTIGKERCSLANGITHKWKNCLKGPIFYN